MKTSTFQIAVLLCVVACVAGDHTHRPSRRGKGEVTESSSRRVNDDYTERPVRRGKGKPKRPRRPNDDDDDKDGDVTIIGSTIVHISQPSERRPAPRKGGGGRNQTRLNQGGRNVTNNANITSETPLYPISPFNNPINSANEISSASSNISSYSGYPLSGSAPSSDLSNPVSSSGNQAGSYGSGNNPSYPPTPPPPFTYNSENNPIPSNINPVASQGSGNPNPVVYPNTLTNSYSYANPPPENTPPPSSSSKPITYIYQSANFNSYTQPPSNQAHVASSYGNQNYSHSNLIPSYLDPQRNNPTQTPKDPTLSYRPPDETPRNPSQVPTSDNTAVGVKPVNFNDQTIKTSNDYYKPGNLMNYYNSAPGYNYVQNSQDSKKENEYRPPAYNTERPTYVRRVPGASSTKPVSGYPQFDTGRGRDAIGYYNDNGYRRYGYGYTEYGYGIPTSGLGRYDALW